MGGRGIMEPGSPLLEAFSFFFFFSGRVFLCCPCWPQTHGLRGSSYLTLLHAATTGVSLCPGPSSLKKVQQRFLNEVWLLPWVTLVLKGWDSSTHEDTNAMYCLQANLNVRAQQCLYLQGLPKAEGTFLLSHR